MAEEGDEARDRGVDAVVVAGGHQVGQQAPGDGEAEVMAGSAIYGTKLVDDPARIAAVAAIGVDETKWLAAKAKAPTRWASAVARHQRPAGRDTVCAVDDSLVTRFSGCSRAGGPRATVTGGPRISSQ